VVVGGEEDLAGHQVSLDELNWLADPLEPGARCEVQVRYRSAAVPATVIEVTGGSMQLALERPVRAIAPGQSGVLYGMDDRVLGGGVIA
jgi:tRNA-specific 2-thiouridylase